MALLILTPATLAQPMRDLVDAALDQKITARVEISERPIREALAELEKTTGLRFAIHEQAIEWMPYGEQTRIAIVMENTTVRDALTRIFDGLGLTMRVEDDKVLVEPAPVLDRLGRRLTLTEARLLQRLSEKTWSELGADAIPFITGHFGGGGPGFGGGGPEIVAHWRKALMENRESRPNALQQLEGLNGLCSVLWVPASDLRAKDGAIGLRSHSAFLDSRLSRPLDADYRGIPLDDLLLDLGQRVGVTLHFAPGALERLEASDREVDLVQRQTTLYQILELISGNTGMWYEVKEDGVHIDAVAAPGQDGRPTERGPRVVAILRVPVGDDGTTIDFLIREDELPPEFRQLFNKKMPEVIKLLRQEVPVRQTVEKQNTE